jgi:hypothetical protein
MNYEFKFGNGINGKRLEKDAKIIIFHLTSNGESGIVGDNILFDASVNQYNSSKWDMIVKSNYATMDTSTFGLGYVSAMNTGNSSNIAYPESV